MDKMRNNHPKTFSLPIYLGIVCGLSWPFQIGFAVLGPEYRPLLLVAMVMAGIGTWVAARFVFNHRLDRAGWQIGKPVYYLLAIVLACLLWLLPVVMEQSVIGNAHPSSYINSDWLVVLMSSLLITLIPAFSEEFSWRGYLLPQLLQRYSARKSLVLHGIVTWFWHIPFLLVVGAGSGQNMLAGIVIVLLVSLVPAVMHAIVFAWFWARSSSLWVATFYHAAFDEVRDSLQLTVGFGWIAENWQMLLLTLLGVILLSNKKWLTQLTSLHKTG